MTGTVATVGERNPRPVAASVAAALCATALVGCSTGSAKPTAAASTQTDGKRCVSARFEDSSVHLQLPADYVPTTGDQAQQEGLGSKLITFWDSHRRTRTWSSVAVYAWDGSTKAADTAVLQEGVRIFYASTTPGEAPPTPSSGLTPSAGAQSGAATMQSSFTQPRPDTGQTVRHEFTWWLLPVGSQRFVVAAHAPSGTEAQALSQQIGSSLATGPCST